MRNCLNYFSSTIIIALARLIFNRKRDFWIFSQKKSIFYTKLLIREGEGGRIQEENLAEILFKNTAFLTTIVYTKAIRKRAFFNTPFD